MPLPRPINPETRLSAPARAFDVDPTSAVAAFHARIESSYARPEVERWPGAVRVGIVGLATVSSWAMLVMLVRLIF